MFPLLFFIILIPFLSILPILVIPKYFVKKVQSITSFIVLLLSLFLVFGFITNQAWITASISFEYLGFNVGFSITSITMILELMTSIVFFASSIGIGYFIKNNERIYAVLFALIEGSSLALFLSSNLLLLYIFWEIAEFSMFFIIYLFGSTKRRYASIKFILYSIVSSLFLLIAILLLYYNVYPSTFVISQIIANSATIPIAVQFPIFLLLLIAFMIKIPIFPFHNWLPDAHTEAPTTGSMILAGVLLKFGGYGLILVSLMLPIFKSYQIYLAILFSFSAIYSVFIAMRQNNLKRAIAYSSITDMAIVSLGIASGISLGINGALYGMLAHAIAISMLFLIAGTVKELYGTLEISALKGIIKDFSSVAYLFILGVFATLGLPLTAGFIADILIFTAAFSTFGVLALLPLISIILLGAFLFWIIEKVFLSGRSKQTGYLVNSIVYSEIFLLASTILIGIIPSLLLH